MNFFKTTTLLVILACAAKYGSGQQYESDEYSAENDGDGGTVEDSGFVTPLDFSPLFGGGGGAFGISDAASNPSTEIFKKVPQQYQSLFDAGSAESQIVLGGQEFFKGDNADKQFSPESFGFIPQFSQGIVAESVAHPKRYQEKTVEIERTKATAKSSAITRAPHHFDVQTKHDNNYKKQPESNSGSRNAQGVDYNVPPSIASYTGVSPSDAPRALDQDHLAPYKKYSFQKQIDYAPVPTYQALTGSSAAYPYAHVAADPKVQRYKRYSGNRRKSKSRRARREEEDDEEEDDEPIYHYGDDYKSRPKEFDESATYESPDFAPYGGRKKGRKEYDYGSDEEYSSDEYDRIKSLSEKQAQEASQNPANCKKVNKDNLTCMVCQNPKTGGSYESCSYVSEPTNNKYAYVKEQKFDSDDEPKEENGKESQQTPVKSQAIKTAPTLKTETAPVRGNAKYHPNSGIKQAQPSRNRNYYAPLNSPKAESSQPARYSAYREDNSEEDDEEQDGSERSEESDRGNGKEYDYRSSIPEFFTDNEEKKNVETVLAEFVKKDRSACKKVYKNHLTCYQCTDKNGMKNEECMFVSESAPKSSHLAYKEIKEFNSKPEVNTDLRGNVGAESKVVISQPTSASLLAAIQSSTELFPKKSQPIKKYGYDDISKKITPATPLDYLPTDKVSSYILSTIPSKTVGIVKRNAKTANAVSYYDSLPVASSESDIIINPADFAGAESKGAFWADTEHKYDHILGVSLPQYMLERSEGEKIFDEALASGK